MSIALNINDGHFNDNNFDIKWDLASVMPEHYIKQVDQDIFEITYPDDSERFSRIIVKNKDLHAMGKKYLMELYED